MKTRRRSIIALFILVNLILVPFNQTFAMSEQKSKAKWKMIVTGIDYYLALKSDGTVWAWGLNQVGQLGLGTNGYNRVYPPVKNPYLEDIVFIAAGSEHAVAIKKDGTVWSWGNNEFGQLGDGSKGTGEYFNAQVFQNKPVKVSGLKDVIAVAAGFSHTLALKKDGTVWAWGANPAGKLGIGTREASATPVQVNGLTDVIAIDAGLEFSVAVKQDGTVWAWGYNHTGQLGDGSRDDKLIPEKVANLSDVSEVSVNSNYTIALKSDGTVWGWGLNDGDSLCIGTFGGLALKPVQIPGLSDVVSVKAGENNIALKKDGSLWAWGFSGWGEEWAKDKSAQKPAPIKDMNDVVRVCSGQQIVVTKKDGKVWAFDAQTDSPLVEASNLAEIRLSNSTLPVPGWSDISNWAQKAVKGLWDAEIISDAFFCDYQDNIKREEFAAMMVGLFENNAGEAALPEKNPFGDIDASPYKDDILKAYRLRIVSGLGNGKFIPKGEITRQEMSVMIYNLMKARKMVDEKYTRGNLLFRDEAVIANWAKNPVAYLYQHDIVKGTGELTISPVEKVTREQALTFIYRIAKRSGDILD